MENRLQNGLIQFGKWTASAADDSPLVLRDTSVDEIYALDWDGPYVCLYGYCGNLVLLPGRGLGPRRLPMHREMVEVGSGEDAIGYSCGTGASVCCDCDAHEHRRLRKSA